MNKKICLFCGKEIDENKCVPLLISYNIPNKHFYTTLQIYCKECNEQLVEPTIKEISEKLKLNYRG